jgi:adenylate cyclase
MIEIERKFLVQGDYAPYIVESHHIIQGYLSSVPERTVRVRVLDDKAFLTVKGKPDSLGLVRFEWEKEISIDDARHLLARCEPGIIEKWRHIIPAGELKFEVDCFLGDNEGLVLAEIELPGTDTFFEKPDWLGKEVTGDSRYYNSYLVKNPYSCW